MAKLFLIVIKAVCPLIMCLQIPYKAMKKMFKRYYVCVW